MYLSSLINGHPSKITDLHLDASWVFITYIEDDTLTTKTIRKELTESSSILSTNCVIESESRLEYNIDGNLNGNPVTIIKFFVEQYYAYFVYIDSSNRLRGVRKQVQSYDTTLLLNSIFNSFGVGGGGTANKEISFVVYESDELVVSATGTAPFVIAETFVDSTVIEIFAAVETSSTSGDISVNVRKDNKLLGTSVYLLDSPLVLGYGSFTNNSTTINETYKTLVEGDLLYVDVISTTYDSANGLYVGVVIL